MVADQFIASGRQVQADDPAGRPSGAFSFASEGARWHSEVQLPPTPSMVSSTSTRVVAASSPWPITIGSGKCRSAGPVTLVEVLAGGRMGRRAPSHAQAL